MINKVYDPLAPLADLHCYSMTDIIHLKVLNVEAVIKILYGEFG